VDVFWFLVSMVILGALAGALARFIVPGEDPMSIAMTVALGIVGSFVGGFLGWLIFGNDLDEGALQPSGIFGSVIGAVVVLLIYNYFTGHKRTSSAL
jgi:uncharacterized membrane protein YeaQ/YmgE (transglycosylase-associated protein family)